jgi:hypothetical protein
MVFLCVASQYNGATQEQKTREYSVFGGSLAVAVLAASQLSSASYSVENWTMDAGGTSVAISSSYSASMTVGQPDASNILNSASYQAVGGFWGPLELPSPKPDLMFRDSFEDVVITPPLNNQ